LYQAKFEGKDRTIEYFSEKRRHTRFKQSWRISWERINPGQHDPASTAPVISQNVSLGGVRFESGEWLNLDEDLLVGIRHGDSGNDQEQTIRIPGRVIWTRRLSESRLAYGVAFGELSPEQSLFLGDALPVSRFLNDMP
nr:PilZ domain-containing protein [Spirochaetota bacterium]